MRGLIASQDYGTNMRKKVSKELIEDLDNLYSEIELSNNNTASKGKSEKNKTPKNQPIKLPIAGLFADDDDDYTDTFTTSLLENLRRITRYVGPKFTFEAYVRSKNEEEKPKNIKDTELEKTEEIEEEELEEEWLLLMWSYDNYGRPELDRSYKKANYALKSVIKSAAKPLIDEIHQKIKKCDKMNSARLEEMIKTKFPIKFLRDHDFKIIFNGVHYIIDPKFESALLYYVISLFEKLKSPIRKMLYMTNDASQKDNARYYFDLTPTKEHFDEAPKLENYSKFWYNFLRGRFNNERMDLLRLTHHIYGLISAKCHSRQSLAIFDGGNTGKSVLKDALARILPGAVQTGVTLEALCGKFPPSQINGCRGLIIDEGGALQSFFDGDFFKSITGATDDNNVQFVDQKFKDHIAMRIGSIRFMFLTNSRLCIKDRAGLTRISPMFFKGNFGRLRLNSEIVNELASEGADFIKFCIDSETYYRNVTSKYNHWHCPLIEDNGTVNILTDTQFDEWYNETSDELYFSEEDQHNSSMRERLTQINLDNCQKVTTDPKTGQVMVYGSLDNEITSTAMEELFDKLFVEDSEARVSRTRFAQYIFEQLRDPKSECHKDFKAIGFKYTNDTNAEAIARTSIWNNFMNLLERKFPNASTKRIRDKKSGKQLRYICGLRFTKDVPDTPAVEENFDE